MDTFIEGVSDPHREGWSPAKLEEVRNALIQKASPNRFFDNYMSYALVVDSEGNEGLTHANVRQVLLIFPCRQLIFSTIAVELGVCLALDLWVIDHSAPRVVQYVSAAREGPTHAKQHARIETAT